MRTLALVSGASRPDRDRTPGRVAAMVAMLAGLGAVDLVVVHDQATGAADRRDWWARSVPEPGAIDRHLDVAARALPRGGFLREVHLQRADGPEQAASRTAWFRVADAFVLGAPTPPDLVWCADLAASTRAGWLRRATPFALDVDRFEDLSSARARRAARGTASGAHLVTLDAVERRTELGLPGSIVVAADATDALGTRLAAVIEQAAAYRPARS